MKSHIYNLHVPTALWQRLTAHLASLTTPTGKKVSIVEWLLEAIVEKLNRDEK